MFDYILSLVCSINRNLPFTKNDIYNTIITIPHIMNSVTGYD